jgi:hypothetical protein
MEVKKYITINNKDFQNKDDEYIYCALLKNRGFELLNAINNEYKKWVGVTYIVDAEEDVDEIVIGGGIILYLKYL